MHGLGNNYVYINEFEESLDESQLPLLAVALSDVRRGIGSDGMILMGPSTKADVRMRIFNTDGSEAENCGNGLRCVAKYAYEHGLVQNEAFQIQYKTGVAGAQVHPEEDGTVETVTIDMGAPSFGAGAVGYAGTFLHDEEQSETNSLSLSVSQGEFHGTMVSMGNPHFVIFSDDAKTVPVAEIGPALERHVAFPNRINVEFVTPLGPTELDFRVWERGSGITYACGTGACASVAAGIQQGLLSDKVTVHLLGGDLLIEQRDGRIFMTGEAKEIFTGEFHWHPENI
ncbi:diaminopimelate epimerase [Alicyclobacillus sp. SO9]|uniref:diaminopimelate epimerase n=1 Tax=Alicyclobacillus sp. SO9 TaxID=2665646 RepID=UPI001E4FB204|nr:diaminopimelate epimerase [Alicyclobacillus sp. SO9]